MENWSDGIGSEINGQIQPVSHTPTFLLGPMMAGPDEIGVFYSLIMKPVQREDSHLVMFIDPFLD